MFLKFLFLLTSLTLAAPSDSERSKLFKEKSQQSISVNSILESVEDQISNLRLESSRGFDRSESDLIGRYFIEVSESFDEGSESQESDHLVALDLTGLKATLRPYQEVGVQWLVAGVENGQGKCLGDDMGLGKTVQTISTLVHLKNTGQLAQGALIIAPPTLIDHWKREIHKFAPHLNVMTTEGRKWEEQVKSSSFDVLIASYLLTYRRNYFKSRMWDLVILDEAQAIKNPETQTARAIKEISSGARIALTGTPIENESGDLWSIFDFLNPGLLDELKEFKDRSKSKYYRRDIQAQIQPYFLRRLKTDSAIELQIPAKSEEITNVHLTPRQTQLYKFASYEFQKELGTARSKVDRRGIIFKYIVRLKQVLAHPSFYLSKVDFEEDNPYAGEDSGKFIKLKEICDSIAASGEKVLIFTQFQTLTQPIADFLEREVFFRPGLVLDGKTPQGERGRKVAEFQNPAGPPFMVLTIKVGGSGLTLTQANHVIHFDRWWNPAVEDQATDRAYRMGQSKAVKVYKLHSSGTYEDHIQEVIRRKRQLQSEFLNEAVRVETNALADLSDSELEDIFRLRRRDSQVDHSLIHSMNRLDIR